MVKLNVNVLFVVIGVISAVSGWAVSDYQHSDHDKKIMMGTIAIATRTFEIGIKNDKIDRERRAEFRRRNICLFVPDGKLEK